MQNVSSSNSQAVNIPKLRFPGFKDEWAIKPLGDILEIKHGKDYKNQCNEIGKYPVMGTGGVITYIDSYLCDWDCVCIGRKGTINKPIFMSEPFWSVDTLFYSQPKNGENPKFQYYLFETINWLSHNEASGVPSLSASVIANIKKAIPAIKEQNKLAVFFSLIDNLTKKQHEIIENLKLYKRGLIFSIFKTNNPFKIDCRLTPLTSILTEYRVRETLGLRVCSVAVNKGVVDQLEHLGRSFSAADTSKYGQVKHGNIVYTKSPTGDFPYGIIKQNKLNETVAVSPLYGVYTPVTKEAGNLLHHYFSQKENANNYIAPLAQKGAKNTINITNLRFLEGNIIFPSNHSDIIMLSNTFDVLERKIMAEEKLLELLSSYKKGLLAEMFI